MGLFGFGKKNKEKEVLKKQEQSFSEKAAAKRPDGAVTDKELLQTFSAYFAPNKDFYSVPGSDNFNAYFGVVNDARDEMINNPKLFEEATKWRFSDLIDMLKNPEPGFTNMKVCGLIFKLGEFAVVKDAVWCVDFAQAIPNCIALYLLLTAHREPEDKRKQLIDAGEGTDTEALLKAIDALKILDPNWEPKIWEV